MRNVEKTDQQVINVPGGTITMRRIPKGSFIMGDEKVVNAPPCSVTIEKSFWMAEKEVINKLYREFSKDHYSGFIDMHGKDQTKPGYDAEKPDQSVIRVSWQEAVAFAHWLSRKRGKKFRLPTEAEWEYAARAGTDSEFYWGAINSDYGKFANFADKSIVKFNARQTYNYRLRQENVNDGQQIHGKPGQYKPNAFGLYDMLGNVAEWTLSDYKRFPYKANDGRNTLSLKSYKVAKGGAWNDLSYLSTVSSRVPYKSYQRVFNVGIRLVLED